MIKILLDQNIPEPVTGWLQKEVGDKAVITSTRILNLQRMTDEGIFYFCQNNKMVIVTYDEDFQNPLVIPNIPGYGVVRLNIYPTGLKQTQEALRRLLENYSIETWENASIVVDPQKIRYQKK
jgi:predicted nuclease of predicted toxin-antitoxin system